MINFCHFSHYWPFCKSILEQVLLLNRLFWKHLHRKEMLCCNLLNKKDFSKGAWSKKLVSNEILWTNLLCLSESSFISFVIFSSKERFADNLLSSESPCYAFRSLRESGHSRSLTHLFTDLYFNILFQWRYIFKFLGFDFAWGFSRVVWWSMRIEGHLFLLFCFCLFLRHISLDNYICWARLILIWDLICLMAILTFQISKFPYINIWGSLWEIGTIYNVFRYELKAIWPKSISSRLAIIQGPLSSTIILILCRTLPAYKLFLIVQRVFSIICASQVWLWLLLLA